MKLLLENWRKFIIKEDIGYFGKKFVQFKEMVDAGHHPLRVAKLYLQYLGKGSGVMIEGRLRLDQWDDKQTGQKRSRLRVTGERMQMLPRGGAPQQGGYNQSSQPSGGYGGSSPQYGGAPTQSAPPQQDNGSGFYNDPPASQGMPPADDDIPF